jgi:hypothetical protein
MYRSELIKRDLWVFYWSEAKNKICVDNFNRNTIVGKLKDHFLFT